MTFFGSFDEGQHVVARNDLNGWFGPLGYPAVKRGTRGIVRATPAGLLSNRYTVEFYRRGSITVDGRHLKPTVFGHGESGWKRYRETRQGISIGIFVLFGLPTCTALIRHYASGGTTADLVAALPGAVLATIAGTVAWLGLPVTLLIVGALWLRRRGRG